MKDLFSYSEALDTKTSISHRKWRETKQQPTRARSKVRPSDQLLLFSHHFLWDILSTVTVDVVANVHRYQAFQTDYKKAVSMPCSPSPSERV